MSKWTDPMTSADIDSGLADLVECGDAEVVGTKDGATLYRLTEQGKARAVEMIRNNAEAREFMARMVANRAIEDARKPKRRPLPRGKR